VNSNLYDDQRRTELDGNTTTTLSNKAKSFSNMKPTKCVMLLYIYIYIYIYIHTENKDYIVLLEVNIQKINWVQGKL